MLHLGSIGMDCFIRILCYSKTCVKWPLKKKDETKILMTTGSLMKVESIAECSLLSDNCSGKPIFCHFESSSGIQFGVGHRT